MLVYGLANMKFSGDMDVDHESVGLSLARRTVRRPVYSLSVFMFLDIWAQRRPR